MLKSEFLDKFFGRNSDGTLREGFTLDLEEIKSQVIEDHEAKPKKISAPLTKSKVEDSKSHTKVQKKGKETSKEGRDVVMSDLTKTSKKGKDKERRDVEMGDERINFDPGAFAKLLERLETSFEVQALRQEHWAKQQAQLAHSRFVKLRSLLKGREFVEGSSRQNPFIDDEAMEEDDEEEEEDEVEEVEESE